MAREVDGDMISEMGRMGRPIPGQSLANNPDNPYPFEKAPKFTNQRKALEFLFEKLTDEDRYIPLLTLIGEGMGIMTVTQNILYQGFREGYWNPDMMLMLAEPTAYILMALAERADIDYVIDDNEEEDDMEEDEAYGTSGKMQKLENLKSTLESKDFSNIKAGVIPKSMKEEIDNLDIDQESLVERPEPSESLIENPNE